MSVDNTCPPATPAGQQTLTWDAEGKLLTNTPASGQANSYIYDAGGTRLVRKEPGATTIYLPGMELRLDTASRAVTGTRFYTFAGQTIAVRTSNGVAFQAADRNGTNSCTIDAVTGAINWRRTTPFGAARGTAPVSWPDQKGFVGGTDNPTTGLTTVGAREYDNTIGRFISIDQVLDHYRPQQMHGYAYGNNSPVTTPDPTGLDPGDPSGPGAWLVQAVKKKINCAINFCNDLDANGDGEITGGDVAVNVGCGNAENKPVHDPHRNLCVSKRESIHKLGDLIGDLTGAQDAADCVGSGKVGACLWLIGGMVVGGVIALALRSIGKVIARFVKIARSAPTVKPKPVKPGSGGSPTRRPKCEHSFDPTTAVLMADGTSKRISDVKVGDEVTATDPETGETTVQSVTLLHQNLDYELTDVTVSAVPPSSTGSGDGKRGRSTRGPTHSVLKTTHHHPFWDQSISGWVNAAELKPGRSTLIAPDGQTLRVVAIRNYNGFALMNDLTVETVHTYYVLAGTTPVLVHNCGDGLGTTIPTRAPAKVGTSTTNNYKRTFFGANPGLRGSVVVHHAIEQQVLSKYPGLFTRSEINSLENLRGIPNGVNSDVHLSQIRIFWNRFYEHSPTPTRQQVLDHATFVDDYLGDMFAPRIR